MLKLAMAPILLLTAAAVPMPGENDGTVYIRSEMQGPIAEATNRLWEIGNNAMDDEGGIDPVQMDEAKWLELDRSAAVLEVASRQMANAPAIKAAFPGHEQDVQPGAYSMKDVRPILTPIHRLSA